MDRIPSSRPEDSSEPAFKSRRAGRVVHALQQVADRMLDVVQHILAHRDETLVDDALVARRHRG